MPVLRGLARPERRRAAAGHVHRRRSARDGGRPSASSGSATRTRAAGCCPRLRALGARSRARRRAVVPRTADHATTPSAGTRYRRYCKGHYLRSSPTRRSRRSCCAAAGGPATVRAAASACRRTAARSPTCRRATAFSHRGTLFEFGAAARWTDPAEDDTRMAAARAPAASSTRTRGVYVNSLSDEGAAGVRRAYPAELARLTALKDAYDPANVFHLNQNIRPATPRRTPHPAHRPLLSADSGSRGRVGVGQRLRAAPRRSRRRRRRPCAAARDGTPPPRGDRSAPSSAPRRTGAAVRTASRPVPMRTPTDRRP